MINEFDAHASGHRAFVVRLVAAAALVLMCFGMLAVRLVYLQYIEHGRYAREAISTSVAVLPITPSRGVITDRNGIVLARNYASYTLDITPSDLIQPLPTVIDELSSIVPVTSADRRRFYRLLGDARHFQSVPLLLHLRDGDVARFAAGAYRFPGVQLGSRLFRYYPFGAVAAPVVGYVGRLSIADQQKIDAQSQANDDATAYDPYFAASNYRGTDYIGKEGIEQYDETLLHGLTGFQEVEVTAGGRPVRRLSEKDPTAGSNIQLSLDIGLQQAATQAFAGNRGALVAIQPQTGEILAFVSTPSYDPNLLVDGIDDEDWQALNGSLDKPLLDRPLRGLYSPGSTYKPFMALAALTLHARTRQWGFHDPGYFMLGNHKFRNDVITGQGWIDMYRSIVVSNDTYYFMLAHDLGVDAIAKFMAPWGFGHPTGVDLNGEAGGILPSKQWKRNTFHTPAQQRWYDGETVSLGIGQGYNAFTILQLAHGIATIANEGINVKPHFLRSIEKGGTWSNTPTDVEGHEAVSVSDIDFVKHAMAGVVTEGSGKAVFAGAHYAVAAKTGTAQVVGIAQNQRYHASAVPERLRDNSLFVAFAPIDKPQIAVALVVENGGWGAQSAGPIARNGPRLLHGCAEAARPSCCRSHGGRLRDHGRFAADHRWPSRLDGTSDGTVSRESIKFLLNTLSLP